MSLAIVSNPPSSERARLPRPQGSNARDTAAPRVRRNGGGALFRHWSGVVLTSLAVYAVAIMAVL